MQRVPYALHGEDRRKFDPSASVWWSLCGCGLAAARNFAVIFPAFQPAQKPAGIRTGETGHPADDLNSRSRLYVFALPLALAALTVLLGLWPAILMSLADRPVAALLGP